MLLTLSDELTVEFYLPNEWWEHRGDACLYANGGQVCFVVREVPGYTPVKIHQIAMALGATEIDLTESEASRLCLMANRLIFEVTQLEADAIVGSSMEPLPVVGEA
ncbi:hypothetical protein QMT40_003011 [Parvibaculaceae bacterium PLY_AMNH_Bact1]|nr:hypothetical protein QMT40_003011 [Parvibaculaceae bacterium PLY_AMNH_Bact1]